MVQRSVWHNRGVRTYNPGVDNRGDIYQDLYQRQLQSQEQDNAHSAAVLLKKVFDLNPASSVLDVGCGLGTWLAACKDLGVEEIAGIDGEWINEADLKVPRASVQSLDLEQPFDFGRRFDLVITIEVAEHLSAAAAANFVASLTRHADCVLFSAAIPFQGGHHHVNEQFLNYWVDLFAAHGYTLIDCLRSEIWNDEKILWWLRQNLVLFANEAALKKNAKLRAESKKERGPVSIVHPDIYTSRLIGAEQELGMLRHLAELVSSPGTYKIRMANGVPTIRRTGK